MNIIMSYMTEEAAKKGKNVEEWLMATSLNASKCTTSFYVGRFSHPSADVKISHSAKNDTLDGYITTDAVACTKDITVSSAAYLGTSKFLLLELEDKKTVLSHFKENTEKLRQDLSSLQIDYAAVRNNILSVKEDYIPDATDERIRQVFFPIGENQYHLLSVLPASSLMLELRKRLRNMEAQAGASRDKKSELYLTPYRKVFDLTNISIGGTQAQNISTLNNMNGGRAYLIPAFPPRLHRREILPPKRNFFQSLRTKRYSFLFHNLHYIYGVQRNNKDIRRDTRDAEDAIIDRILMRVFRLRSLESGWSDAETCRLSRHQKIWLDSLYEEERQSDDTWSKEISREFAGWMLHTYQELLKKDAFDLGDAEFNALRHRIHVILLDTKEVQL